jgi:hypothetical protein
VLRAIQPENVLGDAMNQRDSIDLAGADGLLRERGEVVLLVHPLREQARDVEAGDNRFPVPREECLVKLIAVSCDTSHVEAGQCAVVIWSHR